MSDFFEGLAARNSGAATALRPRVASAYETRDAGDVASEVASEAAMTHASAVPPSPPSPPREIRVVEHEPVDAPAEPPERVVVRNVVLTRAETDDAPPATIREERFEERVDHVHEREHTHHEESRIERVREVLEREGPAEVRPALRAVDDPSPRAVTPPVARPRTLDHRPPIANHQPPTVHRQPPPDPVVRITIGRVEVRAVHPPQPAPRPVPPPAAPGPSLEEFLEQRERRK
jgi:hypothetical protein